MIEFVKKFISTESTFRATIGTLGAAVAADPNLIAGAPGWLGPALMFSALIVRAGDRNPE